MLKKIREYKKNIGNAIRFSADNNQLIHELKHILVTQQQQMQQQMQQEIEGLQNRLVQLDLQLKLQNEIAAVNTSAFNDYKNIHEGKDVAIIAAGPTLNFYEPIEDAIHIGVNRVYKHEKIKLDYYFKQDFNDLNQELIDDIKEINCKKFFGMLAVTPNGIMEASESFCMRLNASRYYVDWSPSEHLYTDIRFHPLMDFNSVVFPVLHFALFTNPKKIYLVGCDTSYGGYFNKEKQGANIAMTRIYLNRMLVGYRRLKEFAAKWYPETEIISINPVNLKGLFRDEYTDSYRQKLKAEETTDNYTEMDFSDQGIADFVDSHIEKVIIGRLNEEDTCATCGGRHFSLEEGLSEDRDASLKIKCESCNRVFLIE